MSERITDERLAEIIDRCRRDWLSLTNPTTKLEDELWNYLKAEREHSRLVRCPDISGGLHRWNGDGQCLECCNYATDMLDSLLEKP